MKDKEFATPEMSKEELVYVNNILFNMLDMPKEFNSLSKPALFRLYDEYQAKGNAFALMEDRLRELEMENNELKTRAKMAETKVRKMENRRRRSNR